MCSRHLPSEVGAPAIKFLSRINGTRMGLTRGQCQLCGPEDAPNRTKSTFQGIKTGHPVKMHKIILLRRKLAHPPSGHGIKHVRPNDWKRVARKRFKRIVDTKLQSVSAVITFLFEDGHPNSCQIRNNLLTCPSQFAPQQ